MKKWLREVLDDDLLWFVADYDINKFEKVKNLNIIEFENLFYRKLQRLKNVNE